MKGVVVMAGAICWMAGMALGGVWILVRRQAIVASQLGRLAEAAALPADAEQLASAQAWYLQRQIASVLGAWFGAGVGGAVLLATGDEVNVALNWVIMATIVGLGFGICVLHLRTIRSARRDGPRSAALNPRRLSDYLTGPEIVLQFGILVLPLITVALGVIVLTRDDRPGSGWGLVLGGLAAYPIAAIGAYLQHRMLQLNQPAETESALRWQEARRATVLRDLAGIVLWSGWMFGPGLVFLFDWPAGVPGFVRPVASSVFAAGSFAIAIVLAVAYSKRALRRSQRVVGQG